MILGIQLFGVLFGLFMIYFSYLKLKKKEFNNTEFVFWLFSWILFIFFVIFPNSLDFIVKGVLQMSRTMDFFIILGFMFLIGLTFYTYTVVNKLQKRMESLVRNMAITREK
ncbi:DUF2304 domain-containing protein [Candidatus Woesearchaeota archaeon]|nr:DUF2304 domain-containing protein [Candidatus Woesearchaeota archaeon]